jgi:hypothetical protein
VIVLFVGVVVAGVVVFVILLLLLLLLGEWSSSQRLQF